jgi:hypothetical protein
MMGNRSFLKRALPALLVGIYCLSGTVDAQFATVINVPPTTFGNNQSIGSDTQLNIKPGGNIGNFFSAGNATSANIEVNISGGVIGHDFLAQSGSQVSITGGFIGDNFRALSGSVVNIMGGNVGILHGISVSPGSTVNIMGGQVGQQGTASGGVLNISGGALGGNFLANTGSVVNISGGGIGSRFVAWDGSTVNLSGGAIGESFRKEFGSAVTIIGGDFRSNGTSIAGLDAEGNEVSFTFQPGSLLSGTLADGTPFAFNNEPSLYGQFQPGDSFFGGTLKLRAATLPAIGPALTTVPTAPPPRGIRTGQTLIVSNGGSLEDNFNAGYGSTVIINGGVVGRNLEAVGSTVSITDGTIGVGMNAYHGSVFAISGGTIEGYFEVNRGAIVNIAGGSFGTGLESHTDSVVYISGGSIDNGFWASGATHLFGSQFILDGVDITSSLTPNVPFVIPDRDVLLTGILTDGSSFDFDLNSTGATGQDYFLATATLTVTLGRPGDFDSDGDTDGDDFLAWQRGQSPNPLSSTDLAAWRTNFGAGATTPVVTAVPEPGTWPLVALALVGLLRSGRTQLACPSAHTT